MKAQILKIAGVKSEKEFYKKYPSEEAFMKKHGKAFKKAQYGFNMDANGNGVLDYLEDINNPRFGQTGNWSDTKGIVNKTAAPTGNTSNAGKFNITKNPADIKKTYPTDIINSPYSISSQTKVQPTVETTTTIKPQEWKGSMFKTPTIPQQEYANQQQISGENEMLKAYSNTKESNKAQEDIKSQGDWVNDIPLVGSIFKGIKDINAAEEANKYKEQEGVVLDLQGIASAQRPNLQQHYYDSPEQNVTDGNTRFPIQGSGSNILAAKNGRTIHIAQNGNYIGGNPTEIQNTHSNGYDIYTDGGYEPLQDSNQLKNFREGGYIPRAYGGFDVEGAMGGIASGGQSSGGAEIGSGVGGIIGNTFGDTSGLSTVIGAGIGAGLDMTSSRGRELDAANKQKADTLRANLMTRSAQNIYHANRKNGGWVSNDWQPQVIAKFGELDAQDYADFAHKDQYRAGGHLKNYTAPSERAMETYAMGGTVNSDQVGDVTIESGGYLEPISWNPHTGGTGFTSKFHGQSHVEKSPGLDHTGIIMRYGGNTGEQDGGYQMAEGGDTGGNVIEAERGEYISERKDGGEAGESAQISGNRRYNSKLYDLGPAFNKEFEGKKIKAIQGKIADDDAKLNKFSDKNTDELLAFTPLVPIDKLKENALIANEIGIKQKYGINAAKADNILAWQNSANEVIDEASAYHGKEINGDDFVNSGGKKINFTKEPLDSSKSKYGGSYPKAKSGMTTTLETTTPPIKEYTSEAEMIADGYKKNSNGLWVLDTEDKKATTKETKSANALGYVPAGQKKNTSGLWGKVTPEQFEETKKANAWYPGWNKFDPNSKTDVKNYQRAFNARAKEMGSSASLTDDGDFGEQTVSARIGESKESEPGSSSQQIAFLKPNNNTPKKEKDTDTEPKKEGFPWQSILNTAFDYLTPSDTEAFDYEQLYPEWNAILNNQLDPVFAQGYQPELDTPYDISLQDQLNANQADFRSIQRNTGYNPAAQSALAAQKYAANSRVLGEQFRLNQAEKAGVYGRNRDTLNKAKLTNLGIYANQADKQSQAKSNTNAINQAALASMTDKLAKHKLENKTLAVYENMYNYRFGKSGKAKNWNGLHFFDTSVEGAKGKSAIPEGYKAKNYDQYGNPTTLERIKPEDTAVTKNGGAFKKNYKNSSVVRAFKNL
jgi:hypothetical protein